MVRMTFGQSLLVSVYGMAVVFVALVALCFLISLFSKMIAAFGKKEEGAPRAAAAPIAPVAAAQDTGITGGQLQLIDVDEKTAAIIMAIVSHESQIPLSELQFKSIKALD